MVCDEDTEKHDSCAEGGVEEFLAEGHGVCYRWNIWLYGYSPGLYP